MGELPPPTGPPCPVPGEKFRVYGCISGTNEGLTWFNLSLSGNITVTRTALWKYGEHVEVIVRAVDDG